MKVPILTYFFLLPVFLLIASIPVFRPQDVTEEVGEAISRADSGKLSRFFSNMIEIGIEGEKNNYSNVQAEFVMRDFFKKNQPKSFKYIHKGNSKKGDLYTIADYASQNRNFRFYILLKQSNGKFLIETIDINQKS